MKNLINDLKQLISNNWKPILLIAGVVYMLSSYADIKQGIMDGLGNR